MTRLTWDEINSVRRTHLLTHGSFDGPTLCPADGEESPCVTLRLVEDYIVLMHRLFPAQGDNYDNEVERQRAVIDQLQRIIHEGRGDWKEY